MCVADNINGKPWLEALSKSLARNLRRMGPDFAPEKLGKRRAEGGRISRSPLGSHARGLNAITATGLPASYPGGQGRM